MHLAYTILCFHFLLWCCPMTAGQLDPQYSSQLMSRVTGQRRDHGTAVLENRTPLSDELSYTHSTLPSNSQALLPLCCLLNHIIGQMCSPSPCPAWSPQLQRDVFETAPAERETIAEASGAEFKTGLIQKKWGGSCLSLWPSPPLPIVSPAGLVYLVNAYTPISSVSFPWGYLHSKAWLSKEAHCML